MDAMKKYTSVTYIKDGQPVKVVKEVKSGVEGVCVMADLEVAGYTVLEFHYYHS